MSIRRVLRWCERMVIDLFGVSLISPWCRRSPYFRGYRAQAEAQWTCWRKGHTSEDRTGNAWCGRCLRYLALAPLTEAHFDILRGLGWTEGDITRRYKRALNELRAPADADSAAT